MFKSLRPVLSSVIIDDICTKDTSGACGYAVICSSKEVDLIKFFADMGIRVIVLNIDNLNFNQVRTPELQSVGGVYIITPPNLELDSFISKMNGTSSSKLPNSLWQKNKETEYKVSSFKKKEPVGCDEYKWIEDLYDSTCGPLVTSSFDPFLKGFERDCIIQSKDTYGPYKKNTVSMGGILQHYFSEHTNNTKIKQQVSICNAFKQEEGTNYHLLPYFEGGQLLPFIREKKLFLLLGCDSMFPLIKKIKHLYPTICDNPVWDMQTKMLNEDVVTLASKSLESYYATLLPSGLEWGGVYLIPNFVYHIDCMIHVVDGDTCMVSTGNTETDDIIEKVLRAAGFSKIETGFPLGFTNTETIRDKQNKVRVIFNENKEYKDSPELESKLNKVGYSKDPKKTHYQTISFAPVAWDKVNLGGVGCMCKTISKNQYDKLTGQSKSMFPSLDKQ